MQKALPYYLTSFLEYCEIEKGLSPTTSRNYSNFLKKFFIWLEKNNLAGLKPSSLTEEHVWKYRMWLSRLPNRTRRASAGLHMSSQTRYLIALRAFLSYFHEKNIECMPNKKIKLPKESKERLVKFLTLDQLKKLFSSPDVSNEIGLRDRAIIETLFSTGMRVAELVSLDRKQFDGIGNKTEYEMSIVGKGRRPRTVYFSERALTWLKKYLEGRLDDEEALFVRYNGPSRSSMRLTTRSIERILEKYSKMAGIPVLASPHTLRHSFATDLLNQGVDIRIVQEFLGHRNIATTQVYTHVTSKHLKDIHKKFHGGREL